MAGMETGDEAAWLVSKSGVRRRIGADGVLIGRAASCDVVLEDDFASSQHALIRRTSAGYELHALGRNPTLVNDVEVDRVRLIESGDKIDIPGAVFEFLIDAESRPEPAAWHLRLGVDCYRVPRAPLQVGGSRHDELNIPELPPGALTFFTAGDALLVEAGDTGFSLDGEALLADEIRAVGDGQTLVWGPVHLHVESADTDQHSATTHMGGLSVLRRARFKYLPSGGELELEVGRETITCRLSELRCRLVVVLLQPPDPFAAGEFVPDEVLIPKVWPRQPERSHYDLNTLVHRLRKDLLRVGLDPTRLVERARAGGGTRFQITSATKIEVE